MKLPNLLPKKQKKLRATTATSRRVMPTQAGEEEQEPTMRLSSAFIVVVILHLVAVGGIYTFESIKAHRAPESLAAASVTETEEVPALPMLARTEGDQPNPAANTTTTRKQTPAQPQTAPEREVKKDVKPVAAAPQTALVDSGKVHVVQKGENPVGIARKYGVEQDALLKLNNISDPRRLQINQKLRIPQK